MRLEEGTRIEHTPDGMWLNLRGHRQKIHFQDQYIINAVLDGDTEDELLIQLVNRSEGLDELDAELRLAQLVIDYGDYLASADRRAFEV
ncbi:MAG: hypothetical protein IJ242_15405 [Clostridia bacterium]|nr:hypothetical protein [Clostridia bacterium]